MTVRPRGPWPGWQPRTARQKGIAADVLARYQQHEREDTLPRGPRGIFYDLRPDGMGNGVTYRKPDSKHPIKHFGADGETRQLLADLRATDKRGPYTPQGLDPATNYMRIAANGSRPAIEATDRR
jgi:hypothetical protein